MKYVSLTRFKNVILSSGCPPRVTAVSMAIGVGLAFSPFPGIHFVIAFTLSRLFRLNGVVLLTGVLVHNPWTMILIHSMGIVIGDLLLYGGLESMATFRLLPWHDLGFFSLVSGAFVRENKALLVGILRPFFVGHLIMSACMATLSYQLVSRFLGSRKVNS